MLRFLLLTAALAAASACASAPPVGAPVPDPTAPPVAAGWPVKSLPHVDLWIHSFALVSRDTVEVPLYRRGYRDSITVVKNTRNVLTSLDANRAALESGLINNPAYIQAQFIAFEFANWEEMKFSIDRFLQVQGDLRRIDHRPTAQQAALWAGVFRTAADREWLRLFVTGVVDEGARFYNEYRTQEWRNRNAVVTAVDSMWHRQYMRLFERFLTNSNQRNGDLILSMPLGGEGRATTAPDGRAMVAVAFPSRTQEMNESMLVFAHEVVGGLVNSVVTDNTSPAEQRGGIAARMVGAGQVRAGAILLQRVAPDLLPTYVRYYLLQSGKPAATDLAALEQAFPLSAAVVDGLERQIDVVLGGI